MQSGDGVDNSVEATDETVAVRVLLVDDQRIVVEAFRRMLADVVNVEFYFCLEGEQAIAAAERYKPTVILQDLVMPDTDGLTLLSQFRRHSTTRTVPIIVLSTKEEPKIKSEAFAAGASDYLVKFPDKIEVVARLRAHSRSYLARQQRDEAYLALSDMKIELERKNAELEALSYYDSLTSVLNRRGFDDFLNKEWPRARREGGTIGLILIDIDQFKSYNDNYGHQGGDECLRRVATLMGSSLKRSIDVIARYGGEEFAVILPMTDEEGAMRIAESLRAAVETAHIPHAHSSVSDYVTISAGVACLRPDNGQSPDSLIAAADKALYQAKDGGRNRCERLVEEAVS